MTTYSVGGSSKTVQNSIISISRNIKAVLFKLGTRTVHHKRNKVIAITTVMQLVLL